MQEVLILCLGPGSHRVGRGVGGGGLARDSVALDLAQVCVTWTAVVAFLQGPFCFRCHCPLEGAPSGRAVVSLAREP